MNRPICRRLFKQTIRWPLALARERAGKIIAARIAIIAITTSSSISVKPRLLVAGLVFISVGAAETLNGLSGHNYTPRLDSGKPWHTLETLEAVRNHQPQWRDKTRACAYSMVLLSYRC